MRIRKKILINDNNSNNNNNNEIIIMKNLYSAYPALPQAPYTTLQTISKYFTFQTNK